MTTVQVNVSGNIPVTVNVGSAARDASSDPLALARQMLQQNPYLCNMAHGVCPPMVPPGLQGDGPLGQKGALLQALGTALKAMGFGSAGDKLKCAGEKLLKADDKIEDALQGLPAPLQQALSQLMPGIVGPSAGGMPMRGAMPMMPAPMPMPMLGSPMPGASPYGNVSGIPLGMPPHAQTNAMCPHLMPGLGGSPAGVLNEMIEGMAKGMVTGMLEGGHAGALIGGVTGAVAGMLKGSLGIH